MKEKKKKNNYIYSKSFLQHPKHLLYHNPMEYSLTQQPAMDPLLQYDWSYTSTTGKYGTQTSSQNPVNCSLDYENESVVIYSFSSQSIQFKHSIKPPKLSIYQNRFTYQAVSSINIPSLSNCINSSPPVMRKMRLYTIKVSFLVSQKSIFQKNYEQQVFCPALQKVVSQ